MELLPTIESIENSLKEEYTDLRKPKTVLIIPDVHLRVANFKNRYDYPNETLTYLLDIQKIVETNSIDIVIFLGDIFDNHFTEAGALQYYNKVVNILLRIKDKAELYTLMGNHELHNIKTSPFFHITEIASERITKDLKHIYQNPQCITPILKAPDNLLVNNVSFEFFHFSDIEKNYRTEPKEIPQIGLFHDSLISEKTKAYMKSIMGDSSFNAMKDHLTLINVEDSYFDYLDYACIGDIHTRIGEFPIGNCLADLPGSIGRTQYTLLQSHEVVDLPIFTITEEGIISKSHIHFPLLKVQDSFKVDIIEVEKAQRVDKKEFKKALERVTFSRDIRFDVENAPIQQDVKTLILNVMDNSLKSNAILEMNKYQESHPYRPNIN